MTRSMENGNTKMKHLIANGHKVKVKKSWYLDNHNTCIALIATDGEPYAIITKNIEELPEDFAAIDTNNCPWAEDFLKENDLGEETEMSFASGFCHYPIYKLNLNKIVEYSR